MEPKELLQQCRQELKEIVILTERREQIQAGLLPRALRLSWDKIKTLPKDHVADAMARVADIDAEILKRLEPMLTRQQDAQRMVDALRESRDRKMLTLYYLSLCKEKRGRYTRERLYTWADVADVLHYDEGYCRRAASSAIRKLSGNTK